MNSSLDNTPWFDDNKLISQSPILIGEAADEHSRLSFVKSSDPQTPVPSYFAPKLYHQRNISWPWWSLSRASFLAEASLKSTNRRYYIVGQDTVMGTLDHDVVDPESGPRSSEF
ncbi:uncharacterized protein PV07_12087 [Cladophialophora immunda]|uniref:Uncharacterized protein n=1 Tax=Cladophialophora immunda TaxID=569365 RepID=A0A0D1Z8F2_9EURO|nr:uncharacterized protein PV07_12087 [Cladophialophora immunda]KIW23926.1 hypothetical protein PV07_12087 [Cladophialophora immunda]